MGLVLLAALLIVTVACVPTPEENVLQPMGDYAELVQIEGKADENAVTETPQVLRIEKDYVTEHGVHIVFDAAVNAPEGQVYPVLRTRTCALPSDRVLSMLSVLKGNGTLCEQPKAIFSREACADRIANLQGAIAQIDPASESERSRLEDLGGQMTYWQTAYESAPAESEIDREKPFDTAKLAEKSAYTVILRENGQTRGSVQVADDRAEYAKYVFSYTGVGTGERQYTGGYPVTGYDAAELPFSESAALQTAEAFLSDLGITEMRHVRTEVMVNFYPNAVERFGDPACFRLFFTREVNGRPLPQYFLSARKMGYAEQDQKDYRPMWTPEYLEVCVDAEGVWTMRWQNPVEIVETINENVAVLSLEDALERFDRYMDLLRANGQYAGDENDSGEITITDVILGYQFLPVKDHLDEYYLTPCWVFLGSDPESRLLHAEAAQLVINAVDGTVL